MKTVNYFLLFLLTLSFSSTAQEEDAGMTIQLSNPSYYFIDGQRIQVVEVLKTSKGTYYVNERPKGPVPLPKTGRAVKLDSYNRSHYLRDQKLDLAFHNSHTGNSIGLALEMDRNMSFRKEYFTPTASGNSFWEAEAFYQYGERELLNPRGILSNLYLFYYRLIDGNVMYKRTIQIQEILD